MNRTRASLAAILASATLILAACGGGLDAETYDQVKVGMTLTEIEGILGTGTREDSTGTSIDSSGITETNSDAAKKRQTYTWTDGDKSIIITFEDGKSVNKSKRGF